MADNETLDELALLTPCAFCGASPGQWCTTPSGARPTLYLHSTRRAPAQRAYVLGRLDAADEAAEAARLRKAARP